MDGPGEFQTIATTMQLSLGEDDLTRIQNIFHELYLERVIVTGSGPRTLPSAMDWPSYRVTDYGKKVLVSQEYVPHDQSGYLKRIQAEIPGLDATIIRYLDEALGCFRQDFLLAASVMLGCAAEKAILMLVESYGESLSDASKKQRYEQDTRNRMISRKFDALWRHLEASVPNLPPNLGDDLHVILNKLFELFRTTRNDAGHPTGRRIERETVYANLILFPSFCRRVYSLMAHFRV
jgi:hypothetical protein